VSALIIPLGVGKCSTFGGPSDKGVGTTEGLSCVELSDLNEWWFSRCFYPRPPGYGLACTLNPNTLYCAMRWGYSIFAGVQGEILQGYTREQVRRMIIKVTAGQNVCYVQGVDWGPNTDTGRLIDLSPGAASKLGVSTDDLVMVDAIL
jgi:hypothetical protein